MHIHILRYLRHGHGPSDVDLNNLNELQPSTL
jgi:hypothetical protein